MKRNQRKAAPLADAGHPGVREFYTRQAVESFRAQAAVLPFLTQSEIVAALRLEAATRRRRVILNRLISRGTAIAAAVAAYELKRIAYGAPTKRPPRKEDGGGENT